MKDSHVVSFSPARLTSHNGAHRSTIQETRARFTRICAMNGIRRIRRDTT